MLMNLIVSVDKYIPDSDFTHEKGFENCVSYTVGYWESGDRDKIIVRAAGSRETNKIYKV